MDIFYKQIGVRKIPTPVYLILMFTYIIKTPLEYTD